MIATSARRWVIFCLACQLFILSLFFRASIAVITPQLTRDLGLDAGGLSLIAASFFYAFALTQLPLGGILDRVGPRRTMTVLSLVGAAGALVFARSQSLGWLVCGRVLLGIGMAGNLMGTFKLLTRWFTPDRFATLSGLVFSIGTAGSILATTPLVLLVQGIGWRGTFNLFAAFTLLATALFYAVVQDGPPEGPGSGSSLGSSIGGREMFSGLPRLLRDRDFWIIALGNFSRYGIFAAVHTLWAGPYLMQAMGFSQLAAGNLILLLNIGFIVGGPLCGLLSDKLLQSRRGVAWGGLTCFALAMICLAYLPRGTRSWLLACLFGGLGVFGSTGGVMYTHIKELVPSRLTGTAMTGVNFFTMIGAALFTQILGSLVNAGDPWAAFGPAAFRSPFLVCAGCLAAAAGMYLFTRDPGPGVHGKTPPV